MLTDFQGEVLNLSTGKIDSTPKFGTYEAAALAVNRRIANIRVANDIKMSEDQSDTIVENKATHDIITFKGFAMKDYPTVTYKNLSVAGTREALSTVSFDRIDDRSAYVVSIKTTFFTNSLTTPNNFQPTKESALAGYPTDNPQMKVIKHVLAFEAVLKIDAVVHPVTPPPASALHTDNGLLLEGILNSIDASLIPAVTDFSNPEDHFYNNTSFLVGHTHEAVDLGAATA